MYLYEHSRKEYKYEFNTLTTTAELQRTLMTKTADHDIIFVFDIFGR